MALNQTHPEYDQYKDQWETIRDAYKGQAWVKSAYERFCSTATNVRNTIVRNYLPPTAGMMDNSGYNLTEKGRRHYQDYLLRAEFPGKMGVALRTAIGILWNKDATIQLPKRLQYLLEKATTNKETLQDFMQRINVEQFLPGRCGVLIDLPKVWPRGVIPTPYLCLYKAEAIINWDAGARGDAVYNELNLVVLDESEYERNEDFVWEWQQKYRVLSLGPVRTNESEGTYRFGQFKGLDSFDENADATLQDAVVLNAPIKHIPFYFINTSHCLPCVEAPISIDLADMCFAAYRNSADYEQLLHNQSQETLVVEGGDSAVEYKIGAHACLMPAAGNKAYFIGLEGKGGPELRAALTNKLTQLDQLAGQMIDTRSLQRESGESLATRLAAQTATLASIAKTCGKGMEKMLKDLAVMLQEDPAEVVVKPNTQFLNPELFAKTLVELMQAKNMGYPIPDEDLVRMAQERGIIKESDVAQVLAKLKAEPPPTVVTGTPTGNPAGKTFSQLTPPAPAGGAPAAGKSQKANPTGVSARGKTRNPGSKSK